MKHFRQIELPEINVRPLVDQILDRPELWNSDDSWTRNKPKDGSIAVCDTDSIVLRYNSGHRDEWNREAWTLLPAAADIVFDVMRAIRGEHLGNVLITRLKPGQKIDWHTHQLPPGMPWYFHRYQIPLSVHPGCLFHVEDESLYMQPGTAWSFDDMLSHAVFNNSEHDRLSMWIDIKPFIVLSPIIKTIRAALSK